jgi:hypothetical protein
MGGTPISLAGCLFRKGDGVLDGSSACLTLIYGSTSVRKMRCAGPLDPPVSQLEASARSTGNRYLGSSNGSVSLRPAELQRAVLSIAQTLTPRSDRVNSHRVMRDPTANGWRRTRPEIDMRERSPISFMRTLALPDDPHRIPGRPSVSGAFPVAGGSAWVRGRCCVPGRCCAAPQDQRSG